MNHGTPRFAIAAIALAVTLSTQSLIAADWNLNNDHSSLHYLSTKVTTGAEASFIERNGFSQLSGTISDTGRAEVVIDLNSVETNIPIRNERMREIVFNTKAYPEAVLTTQLPPEAIAPGNRTLDLTVELTMNGGSKALNMPVHVSVSEQSLTVTPTDIVLIDASDFGMKGGLETLTKLASLAHIPITVPVSFTLSFEKSN